VLRSIRSTVAARFVLDVRIAKFAINTLATVGVMGAWQMFFGRGIGISTPRQFTQTLATANVAGGSTVFMGSGIAQLSGLPPTPVDILILDDYGSLDLDGAGYLILE
jgi:hypothetical protein